VSEYFLNNCRVPLLAIALTKLAHSLRLLVCMKVGLWPTAAIRIAEICSNPITALHRKADTRQARFSVLRSAGNGHL